MKKFLLLTLIISFTNCKVQNTISSSNNKADELISSISTNSSGIVVKFGTQLIISNDAEKLVDYGKNISQKLVDSYKISDKTLTIHLILTKIWEPEAFFLKENSFELNNNDFIEYSLNNLSWIRNDNNTISINEFDKERIYKYWQRRISECN